MNKIIKFFKKCLTGLKNFLSHPCVKTLFLVDLCLLCIFIGTCVGVYNCKNNNSSVEFVKPISLTDREQINNSDDGFFNDTLIGSFIDLGALIIPTDNNNGEYWTSCGSVYLFNYNNDLPSDYASKYDEEVYNSFGLLYPYALDSNTIDYHFMQLKFDFLNGNTIYFTSSEFGALYNIAFYNPARSPLHVNRSLSVQLTFNYDYLDSDKDYRFYNVLDDFYGCETRLDYKLRDDDNGFDLFTTKKLRSNDLQNLCQVRFDYADYYVINNYGYYYENFIPVFAINLNGLRKGIYNRGYDIGYDLGYDYGSVNQIGDVDKLFGSIKSGVTNILDIGLFGQFTFGHILLLCFGVVLIYLFVRQFLT